MTVSVVEALGVYEARKEAAFGGDGATVDVDVSAVLTVGLDLDTQDVERCAMAVARQIMTDVLDGTCASPALAVKSAWYEGLVTGLILAEMRQRDERAVAR
jgi:hypothetical protein